MKLFTEMTDKEKLERIEHYFTTLANDLRDEGVLLQDIWSWQEDWIPWLIAKVKESVK